jgi:hypothetical protein
VQVLHALEYLIHDELVMDILENLLPDGVVEVSFHVLKNEIKVFVIFRTDDVQQFNDIVVVELMQVAYLAVGTLCVDGVLEGVEYFFERQCAICFAVCHLPDVAVCTGTDLFGEGVTGKDVTFNLFCHFYVIGFKFIIFDTLNA